MNLGLMPSSGDTPHMKGHVFHFSLLLYICKVWVTFNYISEKVNKLILSETTMYYPFLIKVTGRIHII